MNKQQREIEFLSICESKKKDILSLINAGIITELDIERAVIVNKVNELAVHNSKEIAIMLVAQMYGVSEGKVNNLVYIRKMRF